MANECLVTKLKGSVDNNNLPIYGMFSVTRITADANWNDSGHYVAIAGPTEIPVDITSNNMSEISIDGQVVSLPANITISPVKKLRWSQVGGKIHITKYHPAMNALVFNGENNGYETSLETSKEFMYNKSTALDEFNISGTHLKVNLSDFSGYPIKKLWIGECDLSGQSLQNIPNFTALERLGVEDTNIGGSMTNLGAFTSLKEFRSLNTPIAGDLVDFILASIANGRTTCSGSEAPEFTGYKNSFKIGGQYRNWSAPCYPTWESATKYTIWFNGVTAHAGVTIMCKGATSEEIAAWEAAGASVEVLE